jgi:site-specific DNA-methyltransferase (cytosine-N4-specific)
MNHKFLHGSCLDILPQIEAGMAQTCVTSTPYYGLRDYGVSGQVGLEPTPDAYVAGLVSVFREVRRVLRDDGTFWLNIGDSYARPAGREHEHRNNSGGFSGSDGRRTQSYALAGGGFVKPASIGGFVKPKDLLMIPARVALALQADGWYLRSENIWHKPNVRPESVRDRPTNAHEKVFLFAKQLTYFYDPDAVVEPALYSGGVRNMRNVWTIMSKPFKGAHFAVMPLELANRCICASSRPSDIVLDPFAGAGTTAIASEKLGRNSVNIELNQDYITLARQRLADSA